MKISQRMQPIAPSATLAVTGKAKQMRAAGVDVISFGAGEPDFDTPAFITEAMIKAAKSGATRYMPATGMPALREALASFFSDLYGVTYATNETMVTVGGKQALFNLFQVLVDPGDEVIIPAPYWVSYSAQVEICQGRPIIVPNRSDLGFDLDIERIANAITDKSVGIVLNSPNNPTGGVYSKASIAAVADLAEKHDLWIITDDIYSHIRYGDNPFVNILTERPDLKDRVFVVHGCSKTYGMTGWRIGFCAGPADIIKRCGILQGQSTSNATAFAQHGALAAVTSDHAFLKEWTAAFDKRRKHIHARLNALDGVSCFMPSGAFYVFPDMRALLGRSYKGEVIDTDFELAGLLLEHVHVAVVPGQPFGAPGFARLSYACSMDDINKGLDRIGAFVSDLL